MPVIFNDETRELVRISLLEHGFELIKRYGMKKTSVEEVAKASGIAKGTFYNFFSSKEEFVAAIILYKRGLFKKEVAAMIAEKGRLNQSDVRVILERMALGDKSLYTYLTTDDLAVLAARVPKDIVPKEEDVAATTGMLLSFIPDKRPDCDWRIVANYMKIMVLAVTQKELLLQDALPKNIEGIITLVINEIFENKP